MRTGLIVLLILWTTVAAMLADAGSSEWTQRNRPRCEDSQRTRCDALLSLSPREQERAEETHLPYGIPSTPAGVAHERRLHHEEMVVNYDGDLLVPTWVAYRLRDSDIRRRKRINCFRPDPRVTDQMQSATLKDYREDRNVFDRGHMAPRASMNRSMCTMINSFLLTNIIPQHDRFNRCTWRWLERNVRAWARDKGVVHVITGAVFDHDNDGKRDPDVDVPRIERHNRVALPSHFYKIVLHTNPGGDVETMTFLFPHQDSNPGFAERQTFLRRHLTNIATVERLTGIRFLADLDVENPEKAHTVRHLTASTIWRTGKQKANKRDADCDRLASGTASESRSR